MKKNTTPNKLDITIPGIVILNSAAGGGKSHLLKFIMYNERKTFKYGIVFSNTKFDGGFDYLPQKYIYTEYDPNILKAFMDIQVKQIQKKKPYQAFVILDDIVDKKTYNCPILKRLTCMLRHYNITLFISIQHVNIIQPTFRANAFQICIFRTDMKSQIKALYESYGMGFDNENEFKNYLMRNTGNHRFIFVDRKNTSTKKEDMYKLKIAPEHIPNFNWIY